MRNLYDIFVYSGFRTFPNEIMRLTEGEQKVIFAFMEKERKTVVLSETGKFLIYIAKLVFGGIILAGIMKFETINTTLLYCLGITSFLGCFVSGLILMYLSKKG